MLRRNIKSKKPSKKLDAVKLGPFKIRKKKGPVSYELELPKSMRIHPVFHISLLEPAAPDAMLQQDVRDIDEEIQEPVYEVEKILDSKLEDGQRKYLVKWTGYDHTENTWEPKANFNSIGPIKEFRRRITRARGQGSSRAVEDPRSSPRSHQGPPPTRPMWKATAEERDLL